MQTFADILTCKSLHIKQQADFCTELGPILYDTGYSGAVFTNGVVCAWGRCCEVPTPVNDRIVEVVKGQQAGLLPLAASNLELFRDLVVS